MPAPADDPGSAREGHQPLHVFVQRREVLAHLPFGSVLDLTQPTDTPLKIADRLGGVPKAGIDSRGRWVRRDPGLELPSPFLAPRYVFGWDHEIELLHE